MTFFDDMAAMAADMLKPASQGGLGAEPGDIVLVRQAPGAADPVQPWLPVQPTVTREILRAHSFGVPQRMIDGATIMAGDQYVIAAVPVTDLSQSDGAVIKIEIDGKAWQVIGRQDIPAAGTRSAVKFMVRR
ncbi:MAG: hypothetical protein U5N55_10755 [Cypionkella sp.]|nr:hypothetical protein [Cypionkella sp.]